MKKFFKKIKGFISCAYNNALTTDRESFAPFVSAASLLLYFVIILIFMPWKHGVLSARNDDSAPDFLMIAAKCFYLAASALMLAAVVFSRYGKIRNSLTLIPMLLFFIGCVLSLVIKFDSYRNFYLNMELLYTAFMIVSVAVYTACLYGGLEKRRAVIYLYGIAGISVFAGLLPPIITGDASSIIYAFRDYVPYALIYLSAGAFCHGLLYTVENPAEKIEKSGGDRTENE